MGRESVLGRPILSSWTALLDYCRSAMQFEPVVKNIYKKHDYHEYGGAPLLGANGICLICHGSSEARTITAAIKAALAYANHHVNDAIVESINRLEPDQEGVV